MLMVIPCSGVESDSVLRLRGAKTIVVLGTRVPLSTESAGWTYPRWSCFVEKEVRKDRHQITIVYVQE